MELRVFETADAAAKAAAQWLASALQTAARARGEATLALSGGRTPWRMLEAMGPHDLPWSRLRVFQVDERAVPVDDERRNGRRILEWLVSDARLAPDRFHAMAAEHPSLAQAAADYSQTLSTYLGSPPVLDVVQLGLGADAHTASLVPGDALLNVTDRLVGVCGEYQGTQRLSLTFPVLNAARSRLWLVTGADKVIALAALLAGDERLPCGQVRREDAVVFADAAAAGHSPSTSLTT
jgi:6-phosphogluconolactonase